MEEYIVEILPFTFIRMKFSKALVKTSFNRRLNCIQIECTIVVIHMIPFASDASIFRIGTIAN